MSPVIEPGPATRAPLAHRAATSGSRPSERRPHLRPFLALARPHQWPKNLLVLAAPVAAGALENGAVIGRALMLMVAFVCASVAVYALNDVRDVELDRRHPVKRNRPVAAGRVTVSAALGLASAAALTGLALAVPLGLASVATVAAYLAVSVAYSLRLKHVAVLDIVAVASGFVLRAIGGAAAGDLPVSRWFLSVSLFSALFVVVGKRDAEAAVGGAPDTDAQRTRPVLSAYPRTWLQQILGLSLVGTVISYAMWAFQDLGTDVFAPLIAASVVPFLIAVMRYALLLAGGGGERPERLLVTDRLLLGAGIVWSSLVIGGLYLA